MAKVGHRGDFRENGFSRVYGLGVVATFSGEEKIRRYIIDVLDDVLKEREDVRDALSAQVAAMEHADG